MIGPSNSDAMLKSKVMMSGVMREVRKVNILVNRLIEGVL
jgi:hypothetical protein